MRKILYILSVIFLTNSCNSNDSKMNKIQEGEFAHIVFFWLKNPNNQEDRTAFEASLTNFINQSEFIKTKHIGKPASTSRGVIDTSYTYCLSLTFDNKAMQDKYQDEPNHKKFIAESENLWEKVIVYDSVNFLE